MLPKDFFAWLSKFVKNNWILIFSPSSLYLRFIEVHICRLWQDWKVSRSWQSVKSSSASLDLKIKCWLCSGQTEDLSLANCSCDVREEAAGQGALSNQEIILSVNTLSGAQYGSCQASQATVRSHSTPTSTDTARDITGTRQQSKCFLKQQTQYFNRAELVLFKAMFPRCVL